ncbi:MAG: nickel pincer cofactor biosynthesis protein LarC [Armatimonadota bacterium]
MTTAYFDCVGGISGDMTLGALLDAGADAEALVAGLRTLALPPWELEISRVSKSGIAATHVEVLVRGEAAGDAPLMRVPPSDAPLSAPAAGHTHTVGHAHAHTHEHSHAHEHTHEHAAAHAHTHSHRHHGHSHGGAAGEDVTRTFGDVARLIRESGLPAAVKERAEAVYRRLAEAEAKVHGSTLETVHFHEVGAVDSIVDVVGAIYALHLLGVERVVCSPLPNGHGFVRCAHGQMPIPPPATAELLKGCPLRAVDIQAELVTPTGAALAAALADEFGPLPAFTIREVGYGAGTKDFPFPNLLRVLVGETESAPREALAVTLLETNIDDQSPQLFEGALQSLFQAGAIDAWITPIVMKKGRPAHLLSVLAPPDRVESVTQVLFRETSTLGVRRSEWQRECLEREWVEVETAFGSVRVKVGKERGAVRNAHPEYEDCRKRAEEAGVAVKLVHAAAAAAAWQRLFGGAA